MYILYEAIASDDPRLTSNVQKKNDAWHYEIAFVEPSTIAENPIKWLRYREITAQEAETPRFFNALDDEVPVMVIKSNVAELIEPTSFSDPEYEKQMYKLTQNDKDHTVSLMKKIMKLQTDNHVDDDVTRNKLYTAIEACNTLTETQMCFATYFEWECAYTAPRDKIQEFGVDWSVPAPRGDNPEDTNFVVPTDDPPS